jgi:hypothetical protein
MAVFWHAAGAYKRWQFMHSIYVVKTLFCVAFPLRISQDDLLLKETVA